MFFKIFGKKIRDMNGMFNGHYIEIKAFYAWQFNKMPCVHFIGELDITKAFAYINEQYKHSITETFQHCWYDHKEKKMLFNDSILVLKNDRMIAVGADHCHILFSPAQYAWAAEVIKALAAFKIAEVKEVRIMGFARQPEPN